MKIVWEQFIVSSAASMHGPLMIVRHLCTVWRAKAGRMIVNISASAGGTVYGWTASMHGCHSFIEISSLVRKAASSRHHKRDESSMLHFPYPLSVGTHLFTLWARIVLRFEGAKGLKTLTSMSVLSRLPPQRPCTGSNIKPSIFSGICASPRHQWGL